MVTIGTRDTATLLRGKTALITGVSSGLGQATMHLLADHGAHVIGVARDIDKARSACSDVDGRTSPMAADLADYASVVALADAVIAMNEPLHMLVCNAGIMALPSLELVEGVEKQFAVNHLGHFVLVNRLLELLRCVSESRIVILSSLAYEWAPPEGIQFDNLSGALGYDPFIAYGQSKLANALFSLELARRTEGTSVTANCLHPGVIDTGLMRHLPQRARWHCSQTVEQGARVIAHVVAEKRLRATTGQFFNRSRPMPITGHLADTKLATRLWQRSEELVRGT